MKLQPHHKTLDGWFGKYIRARDTPGTCCTCGKWLEYEGSECGHFITRDKIAVRWDERNAHAQCKRCNHHGKGEQHKHSIHVDKVHGGGTAQLLLWKSQHAVRYSKQEIKDMTKHFRLKYKELVNSSSRVA